MSGKLPEALAHPRLRVVANENGGVGFAYIKPSHGEADFRVVSSRGYESESMTENAARYWAARWTENHRLAPLCGDSEVYTVETRLVGVTDWHSAGELKDGDDGE